MSQELLRSLGTTYGYIQPTPTTYADRGVLDSTRPAWKAWREIEPTVRGLMAGSLAFLVNPHFVGAVQANAMGIALPEYLLKVWSNNVAMIFGDSTTFGNIRRLQDQHAKICVLPDQLPEWYKVFGRKPIDFSEMRLRFAMMMPLLGTVAEAHVSAGLINHAETGTEYMQDLQASIAAANGLLLPAEGPEGALFLRTVTAAASPRTLFTRREAYQANVLGKNGLLQRLLDANLSNGFTLRSLYPQFGGLVPESVRELLELRWMRADQQRFTDWADSYADKVYQTPHRPNDWFDVAVRTRGH